VTSERSPEDPAAPGLRDRRREAAAFCLQRTNLRRTVRIALVVRVVLTAINRGA
jgi:hypothetical protein